MQVENKISSAQKLVVHFSQFLGGGVLMMLLGFLTFPILTRLLTREDYGILGLASNTVAIAVAIAKGGLSDSIVRFYREYASAPDRLTMFTSTVLTRGVLLSVVVVAVYAFAVPSLPHLIGIEPKYVTCFLVMALYLFVRPLNIIVLNYLRAVEKIVLLNAVNVISKVAGIAIAFTLLLVVVGELYGYLLGIALAELGAGIYLYRWLLTSHQYSLARASGALSIELVKFGAPLLLSELAYLLLSFADRFMIVAYLGQDTLGLYTVGYNIPSYLNDLVMFSLSYAVVPIYTELYLSEGKAATEQFLSRSLNYYLMAMIPVCVGYAAVSQDVVNILASPKYVEAAAFSPMILVGLTFLGMNSMLYAGLYVEKRSGQILIVMLCAVVLNIAANLLLLPRYGATGAAMATLIACLMSSALMAALSLRYLRLRISVPTVLYYSLASAAMYIVVTRIDAGSHWLNLAAKVPAGVFVVAGAMLMRERELRSFLLRLVRRGPGKST